MQPHLRTGDCRSEASSENSESEESLEATWGSESQRERDRDTEGQMDSL